MDTHTVVDRSSIQIKSFFSAWKHDAVKILIISRAFIRIITFHKEGGGRLLEATANSWKNFELFKFFSDDHHIDIRNGSIY